MKKNELRLYGVIATLYVAMCIIAFFGFGQVIGRLSTDFFEQHVTFIEQIRGNFYLTGDFFPQLDMNLGLMQSFVSLYYHGLYNPYVILSFLFPMVNAIIWVEVIGFIIIMLTSIFCNQLLKQWEIDEKIRIVIVILAAFLPVIAFNLSMHLMYIYYVPFLFLNLYATQRLLAERKFGWYLASLLLIAYTNFFMLVVTYIINFVYLAVLLLKKRVKFNKTMVFDYIIVNIIFLLLALFIILPLGIATLSGSSRSASPIFFTFYKSERLLYLPFIANNMQGFLPPPLYIMLAPVSLWLLYKRDAFVIFPIMLVLVKKVWFINAFLNAFQYASDKVDLGFIAILLLIFAYFFQHASKKEILASSIFSAVLFIIGGILFSRDPKVTVDIAIIASAVGVLSFYVIFPTMKSEKFTPTILMIVSAVIAFASFAMPAYRYISYDEYLTKDRQMVAEGEIEPYRQYNGVNDQFNVNVFGTSNYTSIQNDYYYQLMNSNLFAQIANFRMHTMDRTDFLSYNLGVKTENVPNPLPIFYGVSNEDVYNTEELMALDKYQQRLAVANGVFSPESDNTDYQPVEYDVVYTSEVIELEYHEKVEIDLKQKERGYYIINGDISYEGDCINGCLLNINNSKNEKFADEINNEYRFNIDLRKGKIIEMWPSANMEYKNVEIVGIPYSKLKAYYYDYAAPQDFTADINNSFTFNIEMKDEGVMSSSVPYDKGYKVYVDDLLVDTYVVNNYFLGFDLSPGKHKIYIEFEITGFKEGVYSMVIGVIALIGYTVYLRKQNSKRTMH